MADTSPRVDGRPLGLTLPLPAKVAAFCVVWSSAFAAGKIALADCPPLLMLTIRFVTAGVAMLAVAALAGKKMRLSARDLFSFAMLGIFNNALYLGLSFVGLRTVTAGLTSIIVSANPVLTAVAASLVLKERLTARKLNGLVLGMGGVVFILRDRIGRGFEDPVGIVFIIGALLALVAGTLLYKRVAPREGMWVGTAVQNIAAAIAVAPVAFAIEPLSAVHLSAAFILSVGYLALIVSVAGFMLWFHLLDISSATTASSYHFLMPPLGLLFGWALLSEPVPLVDLLGIVPVALGIYIVTRRQ